MKKVLIFLFTLAFLLQFYSCGDKASKHDIINNYASSPISPIRTGVLRQGILTYEKGFECTQNGFYFMCKLGNADWLLYCDHGSDEIIKLCGRPDCSHSDNDCNAFFESCSSICYYDGSLYTFCYGNVNKGLIKIDLDGSNRHQIYDADNFISSSGYKGITSPRVWNGIFTISLKKLDDDGNERSQFFYYKLDGSMDEPQKGLGSVILQNDGNAFVGIIGTDTTTTPATYIYGEWDPNNNSVKELFRDTKRRGLGYIGTEVEYYIENGIIFEHSYSGETKQLYDTGLKGDYQMACFPDCIVVSEAPSSDEGIGENILKNRILYFYDWDFNSLGSVKLEFPFDEKLPWLICGETHERIILTDSYDLIPKYYINKSDFGSGNIEIHEFNLPELD